MSEILLFILIVVSIILIIQVANIIHELGHAIPALLFSRDKVRIIIGTNNEKISEFKIKRLTFLFRGLNFTFSATDYNMSFMRSTQQIAAFAGGPVISFIFSESLSLISRIFEGSILGNIILFISYYFMVQFIISIIPVIYPKGFGCYAGYPSDGYKIVTILKNNKKGK